MKNTLLVAVAALAIALPVTAPVSAQTETPVPSPNEIVNMAAPEEWIEIPAEDLLVMTLAPDAGGNERTVVIQLMPAPFSQGWVENIRALARAEWYDGTSVNRVQDNYVVQWGDPGHDNPESGEVETKPLPEGLNVMGEDEYVVPVNDEMREKFASVLSSAFSSGAGEGPRGWAVYAPADSDAVEQMRKAESYLARDPYSQFNLAYLGWPVAFGDLFDAWPVHCYGMVGVGRNYSPDTGSGAELYTVIGHAPRHLDRNIALVGRVISGMEHLSSLPRGSGALGFYTEDEAHKRTPILSVRVAADLPENERPLFEYLSTEGETFARYAEARANRRDPFFIVPAGGADICNIPVPVRPFEYAVEE